MSWPELSPKKPRTWYFSGEVRFFFNLNCLLWHISDFKHTQFTSKWDIVPPARIIQKGLIRTFALIPSALKLHIFSESIISESIYAGPSVRKNNFGYLPLCKNYGLEQYNICDDRIIRPFIPFCLVIPRTKLHRSHFL
jgi:hypothetical protein